MLGAGGWVIDAAMSYDGMFCMVPYKGDLASPDCELIVGMNLLVSAEEAKAMARGIIHQDGQAAVDAFVAGHPELTDNNKCPDCDGKGEYEAQIGGDGYGDRCCALADVMCVCPTCKGTGRV